MHACSSVSLNSSLTEADVTALRTVMLQLDLRYCSSLISMKAARHHEERCNYMGLFLVSAAAMDLTGKWGRSWGGV